METAASDLPHLLRAVELAGSARRRGNHPFGAVLVDASGAVVLEAENTVTSELDVTGHAELNLVRAAGAFLDRDSLARASLYTSTEPCAMCAGAIFWAGIGRVVYALGGDQLIDLAAGGEIRDALGLPCREVFARGGRRVEVSGPHAIQEALDVHEGFWR